MPSTPSRPVARSSVHERRLPLGAPVRAWALAEWALLPLRLFLGATFVYAGLQKLANPDFFNSQSPSSIQAQLAASARVSPIHFITSHLVHLGVVIGIIIAFSEIAIGLGALLGLWTRIAAIGGAILAFSLFLTVSFHASPFYTGADIVFFFAWLPFVVAGSGTRLSLDAALANRVAKEKSLASPELVAIPFATVQKICGHYHLQKCGAREGLDCEAAVCPALLGDRAPLVTRVEIDSVDRRTIVLAGATAALVGTTALVAGAVAAEAGRLVGGAPQPHNPANQLSGSAAPIPAPSTTTPGSTTPGSSTTGATTAGILLGPVKDVPAGRAASFTIPSSGDPGIVINTKGQFYAYDAVCPHAGCTVGYYPSNNLLVCPCHGSEFAVSTGAVISGPAPHGLAPLKVVEGVDSNLYLQ